MGSVVQHGQHVPLPALVLQVLPSTYFELPPPRKWRMCGESRRTVLDHKNMGMSAQRRSLLICHLPPSAGGVFQNRNLWVAFRRDSTYISFRLNLLTSNGSPLQRLAEPERSSARRQSTSKERRAATVYQSRPRYTLYEHRHRLSETICCNICAKMHTTAATTFGLLFLLIVQSWVRSYIKSKKYRLPPAVPGMPIFGNALQIPALQQGPWAKKLAEQYGEM